MGLLWMAVLLGAKTEGIKAVAAKVEGRTAVIIAMRVVVVVFMLAVVRV